MKIFRLSLVAILIAIFAATTTVPPAHADELIVGQNYFVVANGYVGSGVYGSTLNGEPLPGPIFCVDAGDTTYLGSLVFVSVNPLMGPWGPNLPMFASQPNALYLYEVAAAITYLSGQLSPSDPKQIEYSAALGNLFETGKGSAVFGVGDTSAIEAEAAELVGVLDLSEMIIISPLAASIGNQAFINGSIPPPPPVPEPGTLSFLELGLAALAGTIRFHCRA